MGSPSPFDRPDPYRLTTSWQPVWVLGPPTPRSAWQRWGRNLVLFLLTVASVFVTGGLQTISLPGQQTALLIDWGQGVRLVFGLLSILFAHEMGHYLMCRRYGVDATLPFFLPAPFLTMVGTLGAFIRIRSPIPHRRALFDIGIAGPLAGFLVCLPVLWLGMQEARVQPTHADSGGIYLGEPLLFKAVEHYVHGPLPDDKTLSLGPLGLAAWFGLLVTALNLIPIGQFDGGHVTYALLRTKARLLSRVGSWLCVALIYFGPNWILWAILVRVLGRRHPATLDDETPAGGARLAVGLLGLLVFVLSFVPDPIVWSWRDFFRDTGLARFLP